MLERVNLFPSLWNAWKWWGCCYRAVQSVLSVVSQSDNALLSMSVCERHVSGAASEVYWSDHHCGRLQWVAWALPVVPFDSIESIRVLAVLEKYSVQVRGAAGVKPPALKSRKQEIVSLRFFMMCMVYKRTSPMRSCASDSNTDILYYYITINSHSFVPSVSLSSKGKVDCYITWTASCAAHSPCVCHLSPIFVHMQLVTPNKSLRYRDSSMRDLGRGNHLESSLHVE